MQDFSSTTRVALRELLSEVALGTRDSVKSTMSALLDNMQRYPEDQTLIWACVFSFWKPFSDFCFMTAVRFHLLSHVFLCSLVNG